MEKPILRLRPHHALCLRHYAGMGCDDAFMANRTEIYARLNSGEREMVQLILHRDSLCASCVHQVNAACAGENSMQKMDREIMQLCGLRSGQWLAWQELCDILDAHIFETDRWQTLCADCLQYEACRAVRED